MSKLEKSPHAFDRLKTEQIVNQGVRAKKVYVSKEALRRFSLSPLEMVFSRWCTTQVSIYM